MRLKCKSMLCLCCFTASSSHRAAASRPPDQQQRPPPPIETRTTANGKRESESYDSAAYCDLQMRGKVVAWRPSLCTITENDVVSMVVVAAAGKVDHSKLQMSPHRKRMRKSTNSVSRSSSSKGRSKSSDHHRQCQTQSGGTSAFQMNIPSFTPAVIFF